MTDLSFEEVYRRYFQDVFLFAKGLSGDDAAAEEVTAETFFKALKSLHCYRGECDLRVWLCQIAKNTWFSYCRKRKRFAPMPETAATEDFRLDDRRSEEHTSELQSLA